MSSPFTAPSTPTLRGIIIRDENDRVIVQASAPEIRAFAPVQGQQVDLRQVDVRLRGRMDMLSRFRPTGAQPEDVRLDPQGMLYNEAGQPVALLRQVVQEVLSDVIDVTTHDSSRQQHIHGQRHVMLRIEAEGLPGVRVL